MIALAVILVALGLVVAIVALLLEIHRLRRECHRFAEDLATTLDFDGLGDAASACWRAAAEFGPSKEKK